MKTTLVIFGITGDLGRRKLLPALFNLIKNGYGKDLEIVGVSRRKVEKNAVLDRFAEEKYADVAQFASQFHLIQIDPSNVDTYQKLKFKKNTRPIFYLSVPPDATGEIIKNLGAAGLNTPDSRILFEKPFGHDTGSATELFANADKIFREEQIFRIDHYLEKNMAQDLVMFRSSSALFSHLWRGEFIEKIEIIASEKIGVEGRGDFYEQTGAMRDVIQGHLLQLAALTLMELPADFQWQDLQDYKFQALKQLSVSPEPIILGQYQGYLADIGKAKSATETYAKLTLRSSDPTWKNVPIHLIAGKKLAEKLTEVRLYFRRNHDGQDNLLKIKLDSNSVDMGLRTKIYGYDREFETSNLVLAEKDSPEAYEQVLIDAIRGDRALFLARDEILESWRVIDGAFGRRTMLQKYRPETEYDKI